MDEIKFPTINYRNYIQAIYQYCSEHKLSMILKGSLAKGIATEFSDIDLIILGNITDQNVDELITIYGQPVMTNLTINPKGILILIYPDNISVDLDLREKITIEDLKDSKILIKFDESFNLDAGEVKRKNINSRYLPDRPEWYKVLRLIHKGILKYLSNRTSSAYVFLAEIKENLNSLGLSNLNTNGNFKNDIKNIFAEMCKKFNIDLEIRALFEKLFEKFHCKK